MCIQASSGGVGARARGAQSAAKLRRGAICSAASPPPRAPRAAQAAAPRRLAAPHARRGPAPAASFFRGLQQALGGGGDATPPPPPAAEEDAPPPRLGPPYSVVKRGASYELRVYGSFTAAVTPYEQRPEGLQRLAEYCDGANADAAPLAATQPLTMRYDPAPGGGFVKSMALFVGPRRGVAPGAGTAPPAPAPTVDGVSLCAAGAEAVAALTVTGNVTPSTALAARARLVAALEADGLQLAASDAAGGFRVSQFGPLYSLKPRKNELLLRVAL